MVRLYEEDFQECLQSCERSLMWKVITKKIVNQGVVEAAFSSIWENLEGFRVKEAGQRFFQFFF